MIAKKFLGLSNLIKIQTFYVHEMAKVVVIAKDRNFMIAIFWIMPLGFEGLNNSQKLTVVSFISSFGWNHF